MRNLTLIICLFLFSICSTSQVVDRKLDNNRVDSVKDAPDETDCYRFIGDSTKVYSEVDIKKVVSENSTYYKAIQYCSFKKWKQYYGYTKVWWINFDTKKWEHRWQSGNYWKYVNTFEKYQIVFENIEDKENSIKLLKESMQN